VSTLHPTRGLSATAAWVVQATDATLTLAMHAAVAREERVDAWRVKGALELLTAGDTLPFVARYRKEAHGALDDVQLRAVYACWLRLVELEGRRAVVLGALEALPPGPLRPAAAVMAELTRAVAAAASKADLEELYAPYKTKRKTRASAAREAGLQPLAELLWQRCSEGPSKKGEESDNVQDAAKRFVQGDVVTSVDAALLGARDILAERVATRMDVRAEALSVLRRHAQVSFAVTKPYLQAGHHPTLSPVRDPITVNRAR
jgi:uncharacterized protein